MSPLSIKLSNEDGLRQKHTHTTVQDDKWVWSQYCAALWESFGRSTARDLISFRRLAERLWEPFVSSIQDGTYSARDFSKLMIAKRQLFQSESALRHDSIIKCGDSAPKITKKGLRNNLHIHVSKLLTVSSLSQTTLLLQIHSLCCLFSLVQSTQEGCITFREED